MVETRAVPVAVIALAASLLTACQPLIDRRFRIEGAGNELYDPGMAARTANLSSYFNLLCEDANIARSGTPPTCDTSQLKPEEWRSIVYAGYNDIDARCDDYLRWLESKRNERFFANQTFTALTGLLGGLAIGTGAADALAYVALVLGFGTTVYNAYQDTLLMGLDHTTIKTIVTERRTNFVAKFQDAEFKSKPDAVFVLRSYLRICTPASITMDINIFSREGVAGRGPTLQNEQLETLRKALPSYKPLDAAAPAVPPPRPPIPTSPVVERVFSGPGWREDNLRTLQAAFCIPERDRGLVGPLTVGNVNLALTGSEVDHANLTRRIGAPEFGRILNATGQGTCDTARHMNYYENSEFRNAPASEAERLQDMHALFPGEPTLPQPHSPNQKREH